MQSRTRILVIGLAGASVAISGLLGLLAGPAPLPALIPPQAAAPAGPDREQIAARVRGLEQRLRQKPDDLDGWKMLGRSYLALGRYGEALGAYLEAEKIAPRDAEVRAAMGELSEVARRSGRHEQAISPK